MSTFLAQVEDWVRDTEGALTAILRTATQEVVAAIKLPVAAGGNMPIDTSFLQNSLQGSASSMPSIDPTKDGSGKPEVANTAHIEAIIAGFRPGQTLYFGFTAAYALRQNYGFSGADSLGRVYNQPGRHFVELAVQQWPDFVAAAERRLAGAIVFGGMSE